MVFEDDDEALSGRSGGEEDNQPRPKKRRTNSSAQANGVDTEGPACQSCRKKKARCSRRQPCSACVRYNVECVYDDRRSKPGLRTGAVENLSQRVATLENMFLGQGVLWQQVFNCLNSAASRNATSPSQDGSSNVSLNERTVALKNTLATLAEGGEPALTTLATIPTKDNATLEKTMEKPARPNLNFDLMTEADLLPELDLMDALVDIYFSNIHPWIPMLHVRQFRERMQDPAQRPHLSTIFHAIVSLCARFSQDPRLGLHEEKTRRARRCRQFVILNSMESFSVENLQALTIIAFDTIGSGRGPSAWSIVGSMTRTVEQLQLSVEDEDQPPAAKHLIKRMAFLPLCRSWSEREERRRVFWNIFLMDRFCSVATGWNFSLTSADVKRRLPCEGALWENGEPLQTPTPYFGVADQSSGSSGTLPTARLEEAAQDSLGGFAYCIEATESLSLVTSFFLQQAIDVSKPHEIQVWLMKFKQLDLRLVQWKIFLPEQWREACVLNVDGIMDPNLTLAHLTHNSSVVLLHQGVAYPLPEWQATGIRLPSASSAETCMAAATEVAIIAEKFLQDSQQVVSSQFAFCLFICGRMFLAHSTYYDVALPDGFDSLVNSLNVIAQRWNGLGDVSDNLASKFAGRLIQARHQGRGMLDIRQAVYSDDTRPDTISVSAGDNPKTPGLSRVRSNHRDIAFSPSQATGQEPAFLGGLGTSTMDFEQEASPDSISLAFPPLPIAFHAQSTSRGPTAMPSPVPGGAILPSHPNGYDHFDVGVVNNHGNTHHPVGDFEDLNAYLDYSFLPNQRISMFSGAAEKE
ncbi:fungal-specific transcription factor domain-containing protein [Colletotrichum acutatum]|uniref:Fungal-specific transcription factor domain-containing protein n=1 Tax=Glomerella acutata TaxID=27357 RepID=A0AAD9D2I6_GLOAC|nr:fungal-specific transcription factor domain-containing protein [Colletotrichum acutatum]KAK1731423.1 fungal-specific transcription factor domain-containing protein [Colletotrichum acutatum]